MAFRHEALLSRAAWRDVNIGGCDWGARRVGYFAPWGIPNMPEAEDGTYLTDFLTDQAIQLIADRDKICRISCTWRIMPCIHPCRRLKSSIEKYKQKALALGLDDGVEFGEEMVATRHKGKRIKRRTVQSRTAYAAMIENLDSNIGRLLAALDDNTLVVFTSDNGGLSTNAGVVATCNAPLSEGKGWLADGGVRIPQIAHWPGVITAGFRLQ